MVKLHAMDATEPQVIPVPPNLIRALMLGFDHISNHIGLILFPVLLDLFLWLGPHLRIKPLVQSFINLTVVPEFVAPDAAQAMRLGQELWLTVGERFNLFGVVRTFPVGVFSLMVSSAPLQTPGGDAPVWDLDSFFFAVLWWLFLSGVGTCLGTLYFLMVSQAVCMPHLNWNELLRRWPWAWLQVLLLTFAWLALVLGLSLPFSCMLTLLLLVGINLGQVTLLLFSGLFVWLMLPLIFTPHGIFMGGKNVWMALKDSIRVTRFTLPTTILLFLSVAVLNEGLNLLWRTPPEQSWLTLVGVAGHGFVATSLLAATFVYYQDAERWVRRLLQQSKLSSLKHAA